MNFDSREHSFVDIQASMMGRMVAVLFGIKFKEKTERKMIFGNGRKAVRYTDGETSYEGEIVLPQSELTSLIQSAKSKNRSVTTLPPFDIIVMFVPSVENPVIEKYVVKGVLLEEYEVGSKRGDMEMEITIPFKAADLEHSIGG